MIYRYTQNASKDIFQKNDYHLKKKEQEQTVNMIGSLNVVRFENESEEIEYVAILSDN